MGGRVIASGFLLLVGCAWGPDERHLRYPGPIASQDVARGRTRFEVVCAPCHGDHELRRGPLLVNQRWTPPRIRQRVREGTALMPAIPRHRLSDGDLESLLAYFVTVHVAVERDEDEIDQSEITSERESASVSVDDDACIDEDDGCDEDEDGAEDEDDDEYEDQGEDGIEDEDVGPEPEIEDDDETEDEAPPSDARLLASPDPPP